MVREIKTTLALDGEKQFNAALREAEREMRVMNADLKAMAAEYKATDNAQRYFTERNETLGKQIKQQEEIVEALARAVKESADKFGEAGATTDGYRIKLSNATAKLFDMRREAEAAARELEDLGRDSQKVGTQLERGIGDAAEDVEDKLDGMFSKVASDVEGMKSSLDFSVAMDIGGGMKDFITGVDEFAENTREYRRSLSFLEQNAMTFGIEFTNVKELMFEMASITGEVDSSVEALSNLMAAGFDATEMSTAVDLLAGAVIRFPDTLKFESLADGLQETLATGEATGQYAELLERLGVDLDDFNAALASAKDAEEQQQIALAFLTENGLANAYESYKNMNSELLAAEEANLRLNDAMAKLGEVIDTVLAPAKLKIAEGIGGLTNRIETFTETGNAADLFVEHTAAGELPEGYETEEMKAQWAALGAELAETYSAPIDAAAEEAKDAGIDVASNLATGIDAAAPEAIKSAKDMVDGINAEMSRIAVPNIGAGYYGGYGGGAGAPFGNFSLNIDGQTAGSLLYDGISNAASRATQTKIYVK